MDGNACINDIHPDRLQYLAGSDPGFLLEGTSEQSCEFSELYKLYSPFAIIDHNEQKL